MRGSTRGDALRRLGFRMGCIRSLREDEDRTAALIKLNGQWIDYAALEGLDLPTPEVPLGGGPPLYKSVRSRSNTEVEWYEAEENSA